MDGEKMTAIDCAETAGDSQRLPSSPPAERRQGRSSSRRMIRSELLGRHSLMARNGVSVSIYQRDGKYIVRGFLNRHRFGETLPDNPQMAEARLAEILAEIGNGTYRRRSEARELPLKRDAAAPRSFREIVNQFLIEKRRLRGKATADTYRDRLARPIQFLEIPQNIRRWRSAQEIDRSCAIEMRAWLHQCQVSRNGHPTAERRPISGRQVHNDLSTVASVLLWACRLDVALLPLGFANPFTHEILGDRARRDPLEPVKLPLELRIELVRAMDPWQLLVLSFPLVLPQRPDEFEGLLIGDVLIDRRELVFANRFGGADFNKARQSFRVTYPPEFDSLIAHLIRGRTAGPLFCQRAIAEGKRRPKTTAESAQDLIKFLERSLANSPAGAVDGEQDRKRVFRRVLKDCGGVGKDVVAAEFRRILAEVRPGLRARFYDLRSATITDIKDAGVDWLIRRYVTGKSLGRDTLANYEQQNLAHHMHKYFQFIQPLLSAIMARAKELGIQ
jgi:hypothetical protein